MKILIVGANGYIGKYLVDFFSSQKIEVYALTRKPEQFDSSYDVFNVVDKNLFSPAKRTLDLLNYVNHVIFCAGNSSTEVDISKSEEKKYLEINSLLPYFWAKKSLESNIEKFIFLSSAKVYGDCSELNKPFTVMTRPNPKGIYAKSKLIAEKKLLSLNNKRIIKIIRMPIVYGVDAKSNLNKFIKLAYGPLVFNFRKFNAKRSYLGIKNLTSFIVFLINNTDLLEDLFLISDNSNISLEEISCFLADEKNNYFSINIYPVYLKIFFSLLRKKDFFEKLVCNFEIDIKEQCDKLGWTPNLTTYEGIRNILDSKGL